MRDKHRSSQKSIGQHTGRTENEGSWVTEGHRTRSQGGCTSYACYFSLSLSFQSMQYDFLLFLSHCKPGCRLLTYNNLEQMYDEVCARLEVEPQRAAYGAQGIALLGEQKSSAHRERPPFPWKRLDINTEVRKGRRGEGAASWSWLLSCSTAGFPSPVALRLSCSHSRFVIFPALTLCACVERQVLSFVGRDSLPPLHTHTDSAAPAVSVCLRLLRHGQSSVFPLLLLTLRQLLLRMPLPSTLTALRHRCRRVNECGCQPSAFLPSSIAPQTQSHSSPFSLPFLSSSLSLCSAPHTCQHIGPAHWPNTLFHF